MTTTNPTDAQMKLAGRCATEAYKMAEDDCTTLHGYAVQSALLAIQATEARAQGLVDALEGVLPFTQAEELAEAAQVRLKKTDRDPVRKAVMKARQELATWRRT